MVNVNLESFTIQGISIKTSNANNQALQDIPQLWQRFMSEGIADQIPNKMDATIYCVYTDYEGDHTQPYTTLIGCRVDPKSEIPEGMVAKTFGAANYRKSVVKGDLMKGVVTQEWYKIWQMELPRAYQADFEVYGEKAQNPNDAEVEIFIGVI